jgi:acyl-CoA synthetase (AMP-forming)/AMP-acid ligase II
MRIHDKLDALEGTEKGLIFVSRREVETRLSWAQLRKEARAVGAGLMEKGVQPGERVALVYRTGPDFFRAFFGCYYAGAVPTPLYPPVRLGRLESYHERTAGMLKDASAVLVLASTEIRKLLGRSIAQARPALGCTTLEQLPQVEARSTPPSPSNLGLVQFSSGTTRRPKPVALSHQAVVIQAQLILDAIHKAFPESDGKDWVGVSWLPLYHDMGLIGCIIPALLHNADLALIRPEDFIGRPALWLRALSKYKAIISTAPNFAYALCTQRISEEDMKGVDLSHWKVALNGAEAIQPSTLEAFTERFGAHGFRPEAPTPVYGLSEAALGVCFSDFNQVLRTLSHAEHGTLVSCGKPLPGFSIQIRDAQGVELAPGHRGAIWIQGPSLMEGYLDQPELTAKVLQNGWLNTGDLGLVDQGDLFVVGRATDLIILNGRNHAPDAIEIAVDGLPGLRRGCVAAVGFRPKGHPTDRLLIFVEEDPSTPPETLQTLSVRCESAILNAMQLRAKVLCLPAGTLPRTSSGKIRRREALEQFQEGTLLPPEKMGALKILGALWDSRKHMPKLQ